MATSIKATKVTLNVQTLAFRSCECSLGCLRIKKWPIVVSQIRLHKSKQEPFVVCCAEGIVPRFGEVGFQIVAKLSACQISGIRGEGFGKLLVKVLLLKGYPGGKCALGGLVSQSICFVHH